MFLSDVNDVPGNMLYLYFRPVLMSEAMFIMVYIKYN